MLGHKANSINLGRLKSYQAPSLAIVELKPEINYKKKPNCKTHKHVAGTQYATKQAMETQYRPDPHLSAGNPQMG